eukprot:343543-Chlamydomonas_euryale.AAC.2
MKRTTGAQEREGGKQGLTGGGGRGGKASPSKRGGEAMRAFPRRSLSEMSTPCASRDAQWRSQWGLQRC